LVFDDINAEIGDWALLIRTPLLSANRDMGYNDIDTQKNRKVSYEENGFFIFGFFGLPNCEFNRPGTAATNATRRVWRRRANQDALRSPAEASVGVSQ
jgi:hypothetical protein